MTDIISKLIRFIIKLFSQLLPSADSSGADTVSGAIIALKEMLRFIDMLIPLDTCLIILGLMAATSIFYFTVFIINWIIKRVRGG